MYVKASHLIFHFSCSACCLMGLSSCAHVPNLINTHTHMITRVCIQAVRIHMCIDR